MMMQARQHGDTTVLVSEGAYDGLGFGEPLRYGGVVCRTIDGFSAEIIVWPGACDDPVGLWNRHWRLLTTGVRVGDSATAEDAQRLVGAYWEQHKGRVEAAMKNILCRGTASGRNGVTKLRELETLVVPSRGAD